MRYVVAALVVLTTPPALSQEAPPSPNTDGVADLMETLRDRFGDLAQEMAPMLENFGNQIKGLGLYDVPEVLPNGDIIIRRKPDAPIEPPDDQDGMIDL